MSRHDHSIERQRGLMLIWILAIVVVVVVLGTAGVAIAKHRMPRLHFRPDVFSNPDPHGCLGAVGLYVDLRSSVPKPPQSAAEYQRIARANTPGNPSLHIGPTVYSLALDRSTSLIGNEQIDWNFKTVKISQATAARLIGRHATINYTLGTAHVSLPATVADGRCKSLI